MSVAWRRGSVGTCNVSVSREWDGHGRSVDAHVPVDHASVGLTQAYPKCYCIVLQCNWPWDLPIPW